LAAFYCEINYIYLAQFLKYSEIVVENRPISTHPPEFCAIVGGSLIGVSPRSSATEN